MLACIPTEGNAGREDTVHDHFGSAPYFTLYDSSTDETTVVENRNSDHSHGTCHPMNRLAKYKIDCVVCAGMGRRAIEALSSEGVKVYQSNTKSVSDVIERVKAEDLTEIDPAKACRGHGQRAAGGCGHGVDTRAGQGLGRGAGYGQCGRNVGRKGRGD